jgi:hypothetical protein
VALIEIPILPLERRIQQKRFVIPAWKAIDGPIDGAMEHDNPGPDAYNVFARLQHHAKAQKINK